MRRLTGYGPSLIVLGTAALVLLAGPFAVRRLTFEQTRTEIVQASARLAGNEVLDKINQASRDVAIVVEPSVVHISAQQLVESESGIGQPTLGLSTGSGWIYDADGHIVTNHHVVADAHRIDVQLYTGDIREAMLVGADPSTDIAVIKIMPKVGGGRLHPAVIADESAEPIKQGDLVYAFGSPFDFRFSMSSGVISGKGRSVNMYAEHRPGYENFIQVDAAINPGNSGGPLTDFRGRVIGMNTAIATGRRSFMEEGQFSGIGLAIPMEMIRPVVTQIIKTGRVEKGYLGVEFDPSFDQAQAQALGMPGLGVRLRVVRRDGAAAAAGVQTGDVILRVNDGEITTGAQLQSVISSMLPGESARLTIWRYNPEAGGQGATVEISVPLKKLDDLRAKGELPPDQPRDSIVPLGIARMATSTREIARRYNTTYTPGVMVLELVEDSELARRVQPGSTIIDVMDHRINNVEDLIRVLQRYNLGFPGIQMTVVQPDGKAMVTTLRVQ